MSKIILKKSVHRNFMSYGDIPNEFTFPDGIVLMTAPNGCGKSTIIEVINFALFGTSYRGGNKADLRNTSNTTAMMEVSLEFSVESNDGTVNEYRLFRSINPKGTMKFELERLDDGKWVQQNKRAGFTQKDFEEKVLGFNEVLFKNTIALNTQESTPFIDMAAAKRRELIESIIDMSTEYWKKESGRLLSAAATACDIAASDIERIGAEISNLNGICESLRNEKKANIEQMEASLASLNDEIGPISAREVEISGMMQKKMAEINSFATECNEESEIDASIERIRVASSSIDELSGAEKTESEAKNAYDVAMSGYSQQEVDELNAKVDSISVTIRSITADINANVRERDRISYEMGNLNTQMETVARQGKELKPGVPCPTCGKLSTEADIEPHKKELRRQWKELKAKHDALNETLSGLVTVGATLDANLADAQESLSTSMGRQKELSDYYYGTVVPAKSAYDGAMAAVTAIRTRIAAVGMDVDQFSTELARLTARKAEFPLLRDKWQKAYAIYTDMQSEYGKVHGDVQRISAEIARLTSEIEKARGNSSDDALAMAENRLAEAETDLAAARDRLHEQSDLKAGYTYISKNLCSDDGMKKMLLGLFVPAFNKSVQKNLLHAGLPFSMEFDDTMSYHFISAPGLSPKYEMLSQGQKRKIGFAIAMAFRDFVAMVGNFSINLLSLDEVLDISTDDNAMRDMMDLVRSMVSDIGCALVITHRVAAVMDKFDYWVTIEHDGMYSSIGEMKKL